MLKSWPEVLRSCGDGLRIGQQVSGDLEVESDAGAAKKGAPYRPGSRMCAAAVCGIRLFGPGAIGRRRVGETQSAISLERRRRAEVRNVEEHETSSSPGCRLPLGAAITTGLIMAIAPSA